MWQLLFLTVPIFSALCYVSSGKLENERGFSLVFSDSIFCFTARDNRHPR